MKSNDFRLFLLKLMDAKGNTITKICKEEVYYNQDYMSRIFKQFSNRTMQGYRNHCRMIYILSCYIEGTDISIARRRFNYKTNAFNRALHKCGFPPIRKIKGDKEVEEKIEREKKKLELIELLANANKPIKAKALGDKCNYIKELRAEKEYVICSKPGKKGGYFISTDTRDIINCENWVNNWRKKKGIDANFSLSVV